MCLAHPMRVIETDGRSGRVERDGFELTVRFDLVPDASVGDFVLVHAGFAIERLDAEQAAETLDLLARVAAAADREGDG